MILDYYWQIFPHTIVGFLAVSLAIAILNYFSIRGFDNFPSAQNFPRVSILLPARNEDENIKDCVESLLAQNYPDFEVIVLNDHSTDQTRAILEQISQRDPRLNFYDGKTLPSGWLGKHWACHQLSQRANGELILFTDADTRHETNTLRDSVSALIAQNVDLVTAFPFQEMLTWGEKLTVPILGFGIICYFPILLTEKLRLPALSVTIGQFMLFRRSAFDAIGGYEAIRNHSVDDIRLGHNIIAHGFRWKLMNGTHHIACRMYHNFSEALDGFTKNLFAVFNHHILLYCIGWFWIAFSFLVPILVLFKSFFMPTWFPVPIALVAVIEAVIMIGIAYHRFRTPVYLGLVYPLSVFIFAWIAFRSLIYSLTGYRNWKGRNMAPSRFKW